MALMDQSVFVPPPFGDFFNGMPQLWQFLCVFSIEP